MALVPSGALFSTLTEPAHLTGVQVSVHIYSRSRTGLLKLRETVPGVMLVVTRSLQSLLDLCRRMLRLMVCTRLLAGQASSVGYKAKHGSTARR